MKKELRPVHDQVSCDICGRTILKGERTEDYLAPGGASKRVCDLCSHRAQHAGWIRATGSGQLPAGRRRPEQRGSLIGRLRRRRGMEVAALEPADEAGWEDGEPVAEDQAAPEPAAPPREVPRDPRHVRAVPTTSEVKVERALELFNGSEHTRSIAGIMRSLGEPWVAAAPDENAPSQVEVLIAWELSWYIYRIDLGDADDPVVLLEKGEDLDQVDPERAVWNVQASPDGRLALGVGSPP